MRGISSLQPRSLGCFHGLLTENEMGGVGGVNTGDVIKRLQIWFCWDKMSSQSSLSSAAVLALRGFIVYPPHLCKCLLVRLVLYESLMTVWSSSDTTSTGITQQSVGARFNITFVLFLATLQCVQQEPGVLNVCHRVARAAVTPLTRQVKPILHRRASITLLQRANWVSSWIHNLLAENKIHACVNPPCCMSWWVVVTLCVENRQFELGSSYCARSLRRSQPCQTLQ